MLGTSSAVRKFGPAPMPDGYAGPGADTWMSHDGPEFEADDEVAVPGERPLQASPSSAVEARLTELCADTGRVEGGASAGSLAVTSINSIHKGC